MGKKCIICGADAAYIIKDTTDAYCKECALDCFNDVSFLQKVEEQALELKELIKNRIEEDSEEDEEKDAEEDYDDNDSDDEDNVVDDSFRNDKVDEDDY